MRSKFKDDHPFEKRKAEAERIRQKYSDRIPVRFETSLSLRFPSILRGGVITALQDGRRACCCLSACLGTPLSCPR